MAKEVSYHDIGGHKAELFGWKEGESFEKYDARADALWDSLQKRHREVVNSGKVSPGLIVTFPIADGKAIYVVEITRPLTLQHVPLWDAWTIPPAHLRGLTVKDLKSQLDFEKKWSNVA